MRVCTIVARNYLPQARVLARSFLAHHPDGEMTTLVVDDRDREVDDAGEPFRVVRHDDLPIEAAELRRMATIYDVAELSTAVKPWLLGLLLGEDAEPVTYLDPDTEVFAPLDDIAEFAAASGIVLTPHRLVPVPDDGRQPIEETYAQAGGVNLGFIAVSRDAGAFLRWWETKLARDCLFDFHAGLFVDQRWADLGALYFPHAVLRDPGLDVAYWNLDHRDVARANDGTYVVGDGEPLRVFHYSAFDPDRPHLLSRHQGERPRVLLSERPVLRELLAHYASRLHDERRDATGDVTYGWSRAADGMKLDTAMRRVYRRELLVREAEHGDDGAASMPDPFDPAAVDEFVALLRTPFPDSPFPRVGRYLHERYNRRTDVQNAFPSLRDLEGNHFLWWVREYGRDELDIPDPLVPTADDLEPDDPPPPRRTGVNVVAYARAELGVGEMGRAVIATLRAADEPWAVVEESGTSNRQRHDFDEWGDAVADFDVNIVCVNGDRAPVVLDRLKRSFRAHRHTIGVWAWELSALPAFMRAGADVVDEVWAISSFTADAIRRAIDRPVHAFALPVVARQPSSRTRDELGLPPGFVFLFCFDLHSVLDRKNPLGLIEAFRRAFPSPASSNDSDAPQLVIKTTNGHRRLNDLERIRLAAIDRDDIRVLDGYLDAADQSALVHACDSYVSLHRGEGFGYTMAEAMLASKPVIATGYSGNLDFMDDTNSFLVPFTMTEVPTGADPYPAGAEWADPDLDAAARLMRLVADGPAVVDKRAAKGRADILAEHSPAARAGWVRTRLRAIRQTPPR